MNMDHKSPKARGAALGAGANGSVRARPADLSLCTEQHEIDAPERNTDPYNTSGSFDRTKNWARVGKR